MPVLDVALLKPSVPRARAIGPRERFEALWTAHARRVRAACRGWMRGREDLAEEAFGRVALLAFEKLRGADAELHSPLGWLLIMTRNVCIDLGRKALRDPVAGAEDITQLELAASDEPEAALLTAELVRHLERWLDALPPGQRQALELRALEGCSYPEVAERLAITPANARKRVQLARQRLRLRLVQYRGQAGGAGQARWGEPA